MRSPSVSVQHHSVGRAGQSRLLSLVSAGRFWSLRGAWLQSAVVLYLLPWQLSEACRFQCPSQPELPSLSHTWFLLFLVANGSVQELFQISFPSQCQSLPDFVSDAAQSLLLLIVAKCHLQDQVKDEECHVALQPLSLSCCFGFRCSHR